MTRPDLLLTLNFRYSRCPESRQWIVSVDELQGCHTYGKTLKQASARMAEVIGLYDGDLAKMAKGREPVGRGK